MISDQAIREIANSELDEEFWDRMYFEKIAQQVINEDDDVWRELRGGVNNER
jgi:hypothetical protein